jgi:hypothetical protein
LSSYKNVRHQLKNIHFWVNLLKNIPYYKD